MKDIEIRKGDDIQIRMKAEDEIDAALLKAMAERANKGQVPSITFVDGEAIISVGI